MPSEGEDDNLVEMPLRSAATENVLQPHRLPCAHGHYLVAEDAAEVACLGCGEKLNPIWVLMDLARAESRYLNQLKYAQAELRLTAKKIAEKKRAKCQHCGRMTEVRLDLTIREIQEEQHGR